MALLFLDSFDHYADADVFKKWTGTYRTFFGVGPTVEITSSGRFGNKAGLFINGMGQMWLAKTLGPTGNGAVVGAAMRPQIMASTPIFYFALGGSVQCAMVMNVTGTITLYRGSTVLGTSTRAVPVPLNWNYYELKVTVATSGASISARVNGEVYLALTGQNCADTGTNGWDQIWLSSQFYTYSWTYYDDLYVLDQSGAANNDFWGDVRIDPHYPSGAGSSTDFTPNVDTNWQNVDDTAPDGDTTANSSLAADDIDSFTHEALKNPGATIRGVQMLGSFSKDKAGPALVSNRLEFGGVEYLGSGYAPTQGDYGWAIDAHGLSPDSGIAWAESEFNAMQMGYRRTL
jgi:hypothetical protein